jgi:hypothetical protein
MGNKRLRHSDDQPIATTKWTKGKNVLEEMELIVMWDALIMPIEPNNPKCSIKVSRSQYPLAT